MAATSPSAVLGAESSRDNFVDLDVGAQWWIALAVVVVALLAIDLYRHRDNNEPTTRGAALESAGWVACGLAFGVVVLVGFGGDAFGEYISGYLIEKSLSVDNVFVWSILFSSMAVPLRYQHRVLFWGIFGALTLFFHVCTTNDFESKFKTKFFSSGMYFFKVVKAVPTVGL